MMEQDALIRNLHIEEDMSEFVHSNDDLELYRLGHLKSNILESNPLFL